MARYAMSAIFGFAIVAMLAMFTFPVWQAWIFQFQTLLAGLFAVGAAYATVNQMRTSDVRADQRHSEVLELAIRSDRLKLERALVPFLRHLWIAHGSAKILQPRVPNFQDEIEPGLGYTDSQLQFQIDVIWNIYRDLEEIFQAPAFIAGSDLFGGKENFAVGKIKETMKDFQSHRLLYLRDKEKHTSGVSRDQFVATHAKAGSFNSLIAFQLEPLVSGLFELARKYQIEIDQSPANFIGFS
ncbi:hypothetical protein ACU8MB_15040 [Rhizobium leguminosarum]